MHSSVYNMLEQMILNDFLAAMGKQPCRNMLKSNDVSGVEDQLKGN